MGMHEMPTSYLMNIYNFINFNPNVSLEAEERKPSAQITTQTKPVAQKANWVR